MRNTVAQTIHQLSRAKKRENEHCLTMSPEKRKKTIKIEWSEICFSLVVSLFVFFRRVNTELALQCRDADLLILEGMRR